jgi:hypothetical protein
LSEDVSLRFFQPGDEENLLGLIQRVFEGWPMVDAGAPPIEHLRWKLSSHPAASRYVIVAEAGSGLVAARPFFIQQIKIRGRVGLLRNGFDSAVDPGYQQRGVMAAIRKFGTERFAEEIDLHIGYGRHPAIVRLRKREDIRYFGNPVDVLTLGVSEPPAARAMAPWNIVDCERFDERVDVLYEEASRPFDLILVRNQDYLNWRYCDPRAGRFSVRVAQSERQILGYTVLAAAKGRVQIADVLALPGRLDVVASLVDDAIARAAASAAGALECWCQTHHPYKSVFLDRGFLPKRTIKLTYLALRAPRAEIDFLADRKAAVHFQLGDTDLV